MTSLQGQATLSGIYGMLEAGERGFATAAENMPTQSLKILMKYYAQQHAHFKTEILAELERLGQTEKPWSSIPGMIHRGRISIFAALAEKAQREKIILGEIALGEQAAARAFQKALKQPLPRQSRTILERQMAEIGKIREQIHLIQAQEGRHLVVKLYSNENEATLAARSLEQTGAAVELIQMLDIQEANLYPLRGATILEIVLSGAFGGAIWGGLAGILVGFGATQTSAPTIFGSDAILQIWLPTALACLLVGMVIATILTFFIGISVSEEDGFQLNHILKDNAILMGVVVTQR